MRTFFPLLLLALPLGVGCQRLSSSPAPVGNTATTTSTALTPSGPSDELAEYRKSDGVEGRIKSAGSDTMNNLMANWTEGFVTFYDPKKVSVEIEGKGSTTAVQALVNGTANFGPMSRTMKNDEIDKFKEKYGHEPTGLIAAIDMLAIFVHKDNPLKGLTIAQADAIFSRTRKGGHKEVRTWGDLGLSGEWADKPIAVYGRNDASGTYGYFKEVVLKNGDFKDDVNKQAGSGGVVQGVASNKFAIGYSGIGFKTPDVRVLPLAQEDGPSPVFVEPTPENAYSQDYPLARPLLVYINYEPGRDLNPLRREFIKYVFSKQGQADVSRAGFLPVTPQVADRALASVGIK